MENIRWTPEQRRAAVKIIGRHVGMGVFIRHLSAGGAFSTIQGTIEPGSTDSTLNVRYLEGVHPNKRGMGKGTPVEDEDRQLVRTVIHAINYLDPRGGILSIHTVNGPLLYHNHHVPALNLQTFEAVLERSFGPDWAQSIREEKRRLEEGFASSREAPAVKTGRRKP